MEKKGKSKVKALFPLSSKYDLNWIRRNSLGENVLYNLESLCEIIEFKEGFRVLDLGCGKAVSSIFLAKEFNLFVWALDKFEDPSENYKRAEEQGCEKSVFPMQLDSKKLPFPKDYFDVVICVDSYMYFGSDEKFVPYISQFIRPGGFIGIVDICFSYEINYIAEAPEFIKNKYSQKWFFVHSLKWWKKMWEKTGILKVKQAEIVPFNDIIKEEYIKDYKNRVTDDYFAEALINDEENFINIFRMSAQRSDVKLKLTKHI